MKNNYWVILGALLSTSLLAQQATTPAPSAPIATPAAAPAATVAPATAKTSAPAAKKKAAKKAPQKKAATKKKEPLPELKTVPLVAGPAVVVASNVNVRGQAKLKSEVVARITKGDTVTVIEEIVRNSSGPDEPSAWAKIALPAKSHVWINTAFIAASNQTVIPKKLNARSGAGENYSVIGQLKRGDVVKPITTKGEWTEIEPPAGAYAFVAAQYLKQEAPEAPTVATTPPPPPPPETPATPATVATAPPVAPPPSEPPVVPPPAEPPVLANPPTVLTNATTEPETPVVEEPPPPRIVSREGIVRGMTSIQAPSRFVLISPDNGKDIDYLFTRSKDLDLRRYKGLRIIVTGEESLDERWGKTPVITIQKIQVVE
jgi:uncharacterized protein YgiM (DUF1202 family)